MTKKLLEVLILITCWCQIAQSQVLRLRKRKEHALDGKAFALSISDSTLGLKDRERLIYQEIKNGNVPDFLRKLSKLDMSPNNTHDAVSLYVLPDYFAIGSNEDFFYVPMTPMLAQKVAFLTHCSLPTKLMVDSIYKAATIKLYPQPIAPSTSMVTVPVFINSTDSILKQLQPFIVEHNKGLLTAGNKKDIILSNKIYGALTPRVVIYGWHKPDGKAIQPVYNKHLNTWADYSHGIRLIQDKILINNKKTRLKRALKNRKLSKYFSDEGVIKKPYYPVNSSY
ncbi:hypothetical protein [Pedobacter sp. Leaf194]|uniref:hypothetical protein n=1 Tax=Pedobacter sp. Leaf194 TaxID=1736297 RepID=UPI0007030D8D|nr:hypothetical protein [Pedobacter sp. Leaf194]KQS28488.1 hypothetical protein ASG14_18690 [Pedobacter sp. Leaf194]